MSVIYREGMGRGSYDRFFSLEERALQWRSKVFHLQKGAFVISKMLLVIDSESIADFVAVQLILMNYLLVKN